MVQQLVGFLFAIKDNPEKLATLGKQDTRRRQKKNKKNTAQYV
jgi:hypothetical protein